MKFEYSTLDKTTKTLTSFVLAIFLMLVLSAIMIPGSIFIVALISLVLFIIIMFSYFYMPRNIEITGNTLLIHKILWKAYKLNLEDLAYAYPCSRNLIKGSLRLMGNGGLFGFYGIFGNKTLGLFKMQVTNIENSIVLHGKQKLILSPLYPANFLEYISQCGIRILNKNEVNELVLGKQLAFSKLPATYVILPLLVNLLSIAVALYYYNNLPHSVAAHFNGKGEANGYSSPLNLIMSLIIPMIIINVINLLCFIFMRKLAFGFLIFTLISGILNVLAFFLSFILFDLLWYNLQGNHLVNLMCIIFLIFPILIFLFFIYFRNLRKLMRTNP